MENLIDISGMEPAEVLARLYNASQPLGLGILHFKPQPMSVEEARIELQNTKAFNGRPYFDYLHGRIMKVEIYGDTLDPRLYDRDNGQGAAARALSK